MVKIAILKIITHPAISECITKNILKLHNLAYQLTGMIAPCLEADGVHPKHRIMKYHSWFASKLEKDWDVIDIGCGNGFLDFQIKSFCRSVTGIDINQKNINCATNKYMREGISYICADALEYQYQKQYDAIILSNVLEHIDQRVQFLKKLYETQEKERLPVLLLRVPMITRDWISLYKKEKGVEWRLDSTHFTEYTLDQVYWEMDQAGLFIESYEIQFGEFYGVIKKKKSSKS